MWFPHLAVTRRKCPTVVRCSCPHTKKQLSSIDPDRNFVFLKEKTMSFSSPHTKKNSPKVSFPRLAPHRKKMSSSSELSSAVSSANSSQNWFVVWGTANTFPVGGLAPPPPPLDSIFAVPPTVIDLPLTGVMSLCTPFTVWSPVLVGVVSLCRVDLGFEGSGVRSSSKELTISTTDKVFSLRDKKEKK